MATVSSPSSLGRTNGSRVLCIDPDHKGVNICSDAAVLNRNSNRQKILQTAPEAIPS